MKKQTLSKKEAEQGQQLAYAVQRAAWEVERVADRTAARSQGLALCLQGNNPDGWPLDHAPKKLQEVLDHAAELREAVEVLDAAIEAAAVIRSYTIIEREAPLNANKLLLQGPDAQGQALFSQPAAGEFAVGDLVALKGGHYRVKQMSSDSSVGWSVQLEEVYWQD